MMGGESVTLPLRDIHLPEAISWWPPALGWWLLLATVVVVAVLLRWRQRRRLAAQVRMAALDEWQQLLTQYRQDNDECSMVRALSILLRRVALSYYPRSEVAGLSGEAWLRYLDRHSHSTHSNVFSEGAGRLLLDAPYRQQVSGDAEALHALCGEWLMTLPPLTAAQVKAGRR